VEFWREKFAVARSIMVRIEDLCLPNLQTPLERWRSQIFFWLYGILILLAIPTYVISTQFALSTGRGFHVLLYNVAYLFAFSIVFTKIFPMKVRYFIGVMIFYGLGVVALEMLGPISNGRTWLYGFSLLTGLFLGVRWAIAALTLSMITVTATAILSLEGIISWPEADFSDPQIWRMTTTTFLLVASAGTLSLVFLVRALEKLLSIREKSVLDLTRAKIRLEHEIASRKAAERQMVHSAKLASIGELSTNIAHEIKNPLTILKGNQELLEQELEKFPGALEQTSKIRSKQQKAFSRIRNIVNGLRSFSRLETGHTESIDVHRVISEAIDLMGPFLNRDGLEIHLDLKAQSPNIYGNAGELEQVLFNLVGNAKDALEGRDHPEIKVSTLNKNECVSIEIADNGCGMSNKVKAQIFNSFFTTKPDGKGTGLGLSITQSLVEKMLGEITLESETDKGTTFSLTFPIAFDEPKNQNQKSEEMYVPSEEGRLKGRALIVDDEEEILEILKIYLEEMGLEVETAADGLAAYKALKGGDYDILITDQNMPHLSGIGLIERIRNENIPIKRIYLATGSYGGEDEKTLSLKVDGIFEKPFDHRKIFITLLKDSNGLQDAYNSY
jgi:signal transduction histidine kinase/ActR/RegA family two-component response regulator